jgi:excisionase family DNA binding protein
MDTEQILLTPEQAAEALAVGRDRIFRLLASGDIPSIQIGRSRRITADGLRDYVQRKLAAGNKS